MSARRRHVLVARLDNVGDVLLAGPAVRAIAAGSRRVTFLAAPGGAAPARLLPGVDDVIEFDAPWCGYEPVAVENDAIRALVERVRDAKVDAAFVLTSSHQSPLPLALLLRLAGVPWIGANSRDHPGSLLDLRRRPGVLDEHEVERSLRLAAEAGFDLPPGDDGALALRAGAVPTSSLFDRPYVVVHPGASVAARACGAALAQGTVGLLAHEGWAVAVTGARAEAALTARVAGGSHTSVRDLGGRTDLGSLAGVIAGAEAVVCGNTGPAHVAAAVGTPVVSVFAPVVPATQWHPWRVPHVLLGDQDIACAGCRARTCPRAGQPCVGAVTPADVTDAVAEVVRKPRGHALPLRRDWS